MNLPASISVKIHVPISSNMVFSSVMFMSINIIRKMTENQFIPSPTFFSCVMLSATLIDRCLEGSFSDKFGWNWKQLRKSLGWNISGMSNRTFLASGSESVWSLSELNWFMICVLSGLEMCKLSTKIFKINAIYIIFKSIRQIIQKKVKWNFKS